MTQPPNYPGDNQGYGGYPQGGQGGFPPPPPGYGVPQGGQGGFPPPPGYGGPQFGGQQPFNIGDAFTWAWNKFTKNAVAVIIPILVYVVAFVVIGVLLSLLIGLVFGAGATTDADGNVSLSTGAAVGGGISAAVLSLVLVLLGVVAQAAYISGVLDIADGKQVSIGSFFKPRNVGQVAIAAIVLAVVSAVVSLIPVAGTVLSIVIGFLTVFVIPVIIDRNLPWIEGFKQGFGILQRDIGNSLLIYIIAFVMTFIGACICLIGLLVAAPVAALFVVYGYRRLSGGYVAPLTP